MSEISKAYEPQSVEDKWYQFWLDGKFFAADAQSPKPAYSIVIPPPNVTGVLTMGHVLNNTIQDILARKARMDGKEVLWLPGTDHAGIATQTVVERTLKKSGEIRHRDDLGRDKFLERVWQWKEKHGGIIIQQLKKLGASCDWARERFTMDPGYSRCVQKVFVELYKKGLIYRGKRMVNWCPASLTALSDEEVVMKEQKGSLYYFKVQVVDATPSSHSTSGDGGVAATFLTIATTRPETIPVVDATPSSHSVSGDGGVAATFLTIATTRPETIPGDTAVAVNPKDPRYAKYIGKYVIRPLPSELPREKKLIPIIGDEHVDFEFGTGVLKVTPAHDKADFEIGLRHKLPQIDIMHPNGHMNELAGADLNGLERFKARKVAVEKLTEFGALEKEEPYTNNVGFSERADVPIEPRLSEQWFLKYPSAEKARACVEQSGNSEGPEGRVTRAPNPESQENSEDQGLAELAPPTGKMHFYPQRWAKVYDHWMSGLQDWCISRQLWWGHRIPVWTKKANADGPDFTALQTQLNALKQGGALIHMNLYAPHAKKEGAINILQHDAQENYFIRLDVAVDPTEEKIIIMLEQHGFTQDPDVLDTWFSSWLWPFATMGWPEQTSTLKKFYPTTDLVTGPDIIFFWVARMIMAGYEFMGEPQFGLPDAMPFKNVYFTGIIRDKQGRKMSKSLGNSPDPLDLIAKFGADALRFGVMRAAPLGQDILFDEQNVELGRNFCNKLWNACRFRQMQGGGDASSPNCDGGVAATFEVQGEIDPKLLTSDDKWILLKLDAAIREMDTAFADYRFSDATATLYRFFWGEYCDWYLEASKAVLTVNVDPLKRENVNASDASTLQRLNASTSQRANTLAVIDFVLSHTLRLFHPFLPFITEELWHGMDYAADMPENQGGKTIMFAPWPKPFEDDFKEHYGLGEEILRDMAARQKLVIEIRNIRSQYGIPANKKLKLVYHSPADMESNEKEVIKLLAGAETIEHQTQYEPAKGEPFVNPGFGGKLYIPITGLIDVDAEKTRLTKEKEKIETEIGKVEQKLANPNFTQKVPPQVLEEHKQRLGEWQAKLAHVKAALAALLG